MTAKRDLSCGSQRLAFPPRSHVTTKLLEKTATVTAATGLLMDATRSTHGFPSSSSASWLDAHSSVRKECFLDSFRIAGEALRRSGVALSVTAHGSRSRRVELHEAASLPIGPLALQRHQIHLH